MTKNIIWKITIWIISLVIFLIVTIPGLSEYNDFIENNKEFKLDKEIFYKNLDNFNLDAIKYLNPTILETPDEQIWLYIADKIKDAKHKIYLEVYILTHDKIISELINAQNRWLDVKIILEKDVYLGSYVNNKTIKRLEEAWIKIKFRPKWFRFMHAKYILIDSNWLLSTGNFSFSSFKKNSEFLVTSFDSNITNKNKQNIFNFLKKLFLADYSDITFIQNNDYIILSKLWARHKLEYILKSAKKSITFKIQSLSDKSIVNILKEKHKEWVILNISVANPNSYPSNKDVIDQFKNLWIKVKFTKKPYLHAKYFLVDNEIIYIWSINFSTNSLDNNREVGIIFKK